MILSNKSTPTLYGNDAINFLKKIKENEAKFEDLDKVKRALEVYKSVNKMDRIDEECWVANGNARKDRDLAPS